MAESLTFLREFRSLTGEPAAHPGCAGSRPLEAGNFFGSLREFLRSFGVWIRESGRRAPGAQLRDLSTGYPQIFLY